MPTPSISYLQGKWIMYRDKKQTTVLEFTGNRYKITYSSNSVFSFTHSLVYGNEVEGSYQIEEGFIKLSLEKLPGVLRAPITVITRIGQFIFQVGWYKVWKIEPNEITVSEWEAGAGEEANSKKAKEVWKRLK